MGYLLQLLGVPLIVGGFVGLLGMLGALLGGDGFSVAIAAAWAIPSVLALVVGFLFLRAGRKRLRAEGAR